MRAAATATRRTAAIVRRTVSAGRTQGICSPMTVDVIIGVLLGWAIAASLFAAARLVRPPRVISSERRAMQEALHAATATLPELRRGLSVDSAKKTVVHLRTLTQAVAVAVADGERVLAFEGGGSDHHARGDLIASIGGSGHDDR